MFDTTKVENKISSLEEKIENALKQSNKVKNSYKNKNVFEIENRINEQQKIINQIKNIGISNNKKNFSLEINQNQNQKPDIS